MHGDLELVGKRERGEVVALQHGGRVANEATQYVWSYVQLVDALTVSMTGKIVGDAAFGALTGRQAGKGGVQCIGA